MGDFAQHRIGGIPAQGLASHLRLDRHTGKDTRWTREAAPEFVTPFAAVASSGRCAGLSGRCAHPPKDHISPQEVAVIESVQHAGVSCT